MNASRLKEIVDLVLLIESKLQIQASLRKVSETLTQLVSNPQDVNTQTNYSNAFAEYASVMAKARASFVPTQISLLEEIESDKYFIHDFSAEIVSSLRDNPVSPAVTQQILNNFQSERENYIARITQLRDNFEALHIQASSLEPGQAEIGFLLPRELFNNRLDDLIKELRNVNRIIRAFSEATTGQAEAVEVRQISTSNPIFFFALEPITIASIAGAVTWALNTWKQVEEIRRVRAETRRTEVLTEKEANNIFNKKINEKIDAAVEAKLNELIENTKGRAQEQRTDMEWALKSILAHVERGMTVEVRFLPPPVIETADEEVVAEVKSLQASFQALNEIVPQLVFPKMEGNPVLELSPPPEKAPPSK